jgi:membrane fusion protein (multidrug efflux system)
MKRIAAGFAVLVVLAAVAGLSYWAGSRSSPPSGAAGKSPPPGAAPAGIAVEAVGVASVKLPTALAAVGSLRSDETIIVRPEVAGRVASLGFREGERVEKGAVLVRIDASVQAADTDKARANLTLQKSKHERAVDLRNKGFISSQASDEAENNLRVAAAELELMQARLAKMEIRAPFSGVLGLRSVSVGDYVKEGQDIVNLEAIDPLKVDFRVPEVFLSQVKVGQALQITLDAIAERTYLGRVSAINPLIDANGRAVVIRATVPNSDARLRPGMFARVMLLTSELKDSFVVPEEALFPVGDDKYVYRIEADRARRQKVQIGQRREGKVEITGGLSAGDRVVTAGQIKLRDGAVVSVSNPPPVASAPAKREGAPKSGS